MNPNNSWGFFVIRHIYIKNISMILSVWKPRYKTINKIKTKIFYELVSVDEMLNFKKKGWVVTYKCDKCCSDKIHSTTSHVLFNYKNKINNLNHQTCKSCRSRISEYEIKNNYIKYNTIKDSLNNDGYLILTNEEEYNKSHKKSQFKIDVVCNNGHELKVTWNNWNKGKRCLKCYNDLRISNAIKYKTGYDRYKFLVLYYTEQNYKNHFDFINPNSYNRGKDYHLDHKYSIYEGFVNNLSPKMIGSKENLEVIPSKINLSKQNRCSISLDELFKLTEYLFKKQ